MRKRNSDKECYQEPQKKQENKAEKSNALKNSLNSAQHDQKKKVTRNEPFWWLMI